MILTHSIKVCLAVEPCDLRKSFDTLSAVVREELCEDPLSQKVFVFLNRNGKQLSFSIPIRYRGHRIPVAPLTRAALARGPAQGAERDRGH